jgi:ABC-2 type transport system ATP-binding protein
MIELDNVSRSYGRKVAVDGLSLTVQPGELFALLGPNGAGKTTSIKMLVGLLRPDRGAVRVCDHDVVRQPRAAAQQLGYVPDQAFLYDKLTGREFLEFLAQVRGMEPAVWQESLARQADQFELNDFLDELTETYSHGMRQRLVFASALLHDPAALVVDEPMVGLDPRAARVVKDLLRARAAAGTSVFMSTHTLSVAEEIADRIGIVDHGRLRFLGTVEELRAELSSPQSSLESLYLALTNGHAEEPVSTEPISTEPGFKSSREQS